MRCARSPVSSSTIKLNAQPAILPREALLDETLERLSDEVDDYTIEARAVSIALARGFQNTVAEAMQIVQEHSSQPGTYVEEQLYSGGFPSFSDTRLAALFHRMSDWRQRLALVNEFEDARLRTHSLRLVYTEAPGALPAPVLDEMHDFTRERLLSLDDGLPFLTIHSACEELQALAAREAEIGSHSNFARSTTGRDTTSVRTVGAAGAKTVAKRLEEIEEYYLMLASGHQ